VGLQWIEVDRAVPPALPASDAAVPADRHLSPAHRVPCGPPPGDPLRIPRCTAEEHFVSFCLI